MKRAIAIAIAGAFTLSANAGDWGGKDVVGPKAPVGCPDTNGNIAAGYMSDYLFYGSRLAEDSLWGSVDYTFDVGIPITIGAWYLNEVNSYNGAAGYGDELDLTVSAAVASVAGFDISIGYTRYLFPSTAGSRQQNEYGIDISRDLGFATLLLESNYNSTLSNGATGPGGGAWYHQAGLEREFGLTDAISLVLDCGIGYSDGYFPVGTGLSNTSGWNHYFFTASLPIQLNCTTTITPYIGYVGAPDGFVLDGFNSAATGGVGNAQSDILHGGISINVAF